MSWATFTRVPLPEGAIVDVTFMVAWPLPFSSDPDASMTIRLAASSRWTIFAVQELELYGPHLGRHAALVHVAVDIDELGTRQARRDPRHVLHVLPHLLERCSNLELVFNQHRLLALPYHSRVRACDSRLRPRPDKFPGIVLKRP